MRSVCRNSLRPLIHTTAAIAVLVSLFPLDGKPPDTPAGVRTAIELIDKRGLGYCFKVNGLKSVARS